MHTERVQLLPGRLPPGQRKQAAPPGEVGLAAWRFAGSGRREMSMPWAMAVSVVDMVWALLAAWVSTCLSAATAVARAARTGEIGHLHIA
ncbi:unnamed protein product [Urochloa humidicola]